VAVLSLVLASGAEAADPNLVGWWPLNEGIGETVVDMSGNGVDGTIHNAANGLGMDGSVWVEDPDLGAVISFDGTASGAYVRAGSIPQMTLENNFTWAFWAKQAPGNGSNDIILGNRMDENAVDFVPRQFIKFTPTKFEWHMNGNGDDNMEYEDIPNDVWLHHVVVKTADQLTYYRNGMVAGTGTITQALDFPQPLYFGGDNEGAEGENGAGFMSAGRTYAGALSPEQGQAIMGGPAPATLAAWEDAAMAAEPGFFATNVEDGLYDIGVFGGEMTYEFLVRSNPDETQASMCLIGRRDFGDTQSGLKYEQWNNTGTYGATLFGVADYDFGVANTPGLFTHLVFVASAEAGATDLYVNGAYKGSVAAAITLSGLVGIGYGAQDREGADPFFDDFDGEIFGVAIYDRALSKGEIRVNADTYLERGPSDITAAGDAVQGVPNDGDWPGAETPNLAIDDNVATKYLHFKGETQPTGFQVTPALGATLVTGLTLTTANDAVERDPIAFELYGSNESIEGPYELIAAGEVADFNQVDAWPRFTMNATPIAFENTTVYKHYQILFPAVRDPGSANSMQIAEVELIGVPALYVLFTEDFEGLPLGPNVDEVVAGEAVWTKIAPEGWLIDDSGMPGVDDPATDGVTEWAGWSFADKDWWVQAAEDQDRSKFTFGTGTVAIADPDEWDDAPHAEGWFNSFLSTPAIDVSGVEANMLQLRFASSWRPEYDSNYHQTANVTVSFDGGEPVEVLLWESDESSPNYKPYATNEWVTVGIRKPAGAQTMVVTFGLFDAGNDWWWAIDNVQIASN
jgi:hypothetical protein